MGAQETRREIDRWLTGPEHSLRGIGDPYNFLQFHVRHHMQEAFDWRAAVEYWSELVRCGVVAQVAHSGVGGVAADSSYFFVTARGRELLAKRPAPHDRHGYLAALRATRDFDEIAVGLADEALGAWQSGLWRASAVMLGVACERLVILIAESVEAKGTVPYATNLSRMLHPKKGKPPAGISEVFAQVRGAVLTLDGESESFDRDVSSIFQHARQLRNDSGHPTGKLVTAEEAQAGLLLFPSFHAKAMALIDRIKTS
jgi:hypothetical protein